MYKTKNGQSSSKLLTTAQNMMIRLNVFVETKEKKILERD